MGQMTRLAAVVALVAALVAVGAGCGRKGAPVLPKQAGAKYPPCSASQASCEKG